MGKVVSSLMVVLIVFLCACAGETEEETVSDGVWCYLPHPRDYSSDFRKGDRNNEFLTASYVSEWTGEFSGTSEDYGMMIVHESGREIYIGEILFETIEIDGSSGSLELYAMGEVPDRVSDWEGTWVIVDGTGE